MPLTVKPNEALLTGNPETDPPFVLLMGQRWPIPKFAPKQNSVIVPIVMALMPKIVKSMNEPEVDDKGLPVMVPMIDPATNEAFLDDAGAVKLVPKRRGAIDAMSGIMTEENLNKLYTCLYMALTRAHPKLQRKEFDEELEVGTLELLDCVFTIANQTGVIKFQKAKSPQEQAAALVFGKPAQSLGEAMAADSPTGAP